MENKGIIATILLSFVVAAIILLSIPIIILILFSTIIGSILGLINPQQSGIANVDIITITADEVKNDLNIQNDIDVAVLKAIDFCDNQNIVQTKDEALSLINYFVKEEKTINDDGKKETKYLFYTDTEIIETIKKSPFSLNDFDTQLVYELALAPIEDKQEIEEFTGKLIMPCPGSITSSYGMRLHPVLNKKYFHYGIDIGSPWHSPLVAIADGVVVEVNKIKGDGYGNNITIRHKIKEYGVFYTSYNHLSDIKVKKGQKVKQGEVVAIEGGDQRKDPNPGTTTGHHLHFEIRTGIERKTAVNPLKYLSGLT